MNINISITGDVAKIGIDTEDAAVLIECVGGKSKIRTTLDITGTRKFVMMAMNEVSNKVNMPLVEAELKSC